MIFEAGAEVVVVVAVAVVKVAVAEVLLVVSIIDTKSYKSELGQQENINR